AVTVHAADDSRIFAVGGSVGVGKNVGIGAAVGYDEIDNTVRAYVEDSYLSAGGAVTVRAEEKAYIAGVTVGGAGSKNVSLAGSGAGEPDPPHAPPPTTT